MGAFWAAARILPHTETLALHCLDLSGFTTYCPRIRESRRFNGRKVVTTPPLFPGYLFVAIELQWHAARWALGVANLIMDGERPAKVPDHVIDTPRARERNGLVVLPPKASVASFPVGEHVRVHSGSLTGCFGIVSGMRPHQRVLVLLSLLGSPREVTLSQDDVRVVRRPS